MNSEINHFNPRRNLTCQTPNQISVCVCGDSLSMFTFYLRIYVYIDLYVCKKMCVPMLMYNCKKPRNSVTAHVFVACETVLI